MCQYYYLVPDEENKILKKSFKNLVCLPSFEACFKTKRDAERYLVRRELVKISTDLNKEFKAPLNWQYKKQAKWRIKLDTSSRNLVLECSLGDKKKGDSVYCLSSKILDEAIFYIGEKKLIEYFRDKED